MIEEEFVRAYIVLRDGGYVYTRCSKEQVRQLIRERKAQGRASDPYLVTNEDETFLVDLSQVVGVYCLKDDSMQERQVRAAEEMAKMARAVRQEVVAGEGWRGG